MADTYGAVEMRSALGRMRRSGGLPVAFGGLFEGTRQFRIAELAGTATPVLLGLTITTGNGLGGKAMALSRPVYVSDYPASRVISHEYDAAVAAEGLRCVLAVPVAVRRRVRGVLYGALRQPMALGDRTMSVAVEAARELEQAPPCVTPRRTRHSGVLTATSRPPEADAAAWEEVRAAHGELRALAQRVHDQKLRHDLLAVLGRLATASPEAAPPPDRAPHLPSVELSPREVDVLACVASDTTNATAADRLGLRPETVQELSAVVHAEAGCPHAAPGRGLGPPSGAVAVAVRRHCGCRPVGQTVGAAAIHGRGWRSRSGACLCSWCTVGRMGAR